MRVERRSERLKQAGRGSQGLREMMPMLHCLCVYFLLLASCLLMRILQPPWSRLYYCSMQSVTGFLPSLFPLRAGTPTSQGPSWH